MYEKLIPVELSNYVEALHCGNVIFKKSLPKRLQKKAQKAQERYSVFSSYAAAHPVYTGKETTLKERMNGIAYSEVPGFMQEYIKYEKENIVKKDDFPDDLNEQFDKCKKIFDIDLKYYQYENFYLDFDGTRKLNPWEKLNIIFGHKKFINFVAD